MNLVFRPRQCLSGKPNNPRRLQSRSEEFLHIHHPDLPPHHCHRPCLPHHPYIHPYPSPDWSLPLPSWCCLWDTGPQYCSYHHCPCHHPIHLVFHRCRNPVVWMRDCLDWSPIEFLGYCWIHPHLYHHPRLARCCNFPWWSPVFHPCPCHPWHTYHLGIHRHCHLLRHHQSPSIRPGHMGTHPCCPGIHHYQNPWSYFLHFHSDPYLHHPYHRSVRYWGYYFGQWAHHFQFPLGSHW